MLCECRPTRPVRGLTSVAAQEAVSTQERKMGKMTSVKKASSPKSASRIVGELKKPINSRKAMGASNVRPLKKKKKAAPHRRPCSTEASATMPSAPGARPPVSKQATVLTLLRGPEGVTIAAIKEATQWQSHSVRGFLASVVHKQLKLELVSEKVDGERRYRILGAGGDK
jgi:hypothetical protein